MALGVRLTFVSVGLSGALLGHLELGAVLGSGGMSTVYRALNHHTGSVVACKVMHRGASSDPHLRAQFSGPPTVVDHPHLVPILELGEYREVLFLTMPLVTGTDLATDIDRNGPMAVSRAMTVFEQLAAALEAIHRSGLIHLDVKPANVLLTRRSALLSDFGLATADDRGRAVRSEAGDFIGSPAYASPEHLRGQPVTRVTDVYSLACLMFTVLAGRPPYIGDLRAVIRGHLGSGVPSVSHLAGLPAALDQVLAGALSQEPAHRPPRPTDLVRQTRLALAG